MSPLVFYSVIPKCDSPIYGKKRYSAEFKAGVKIDMREHLCPYLSGTSSVKERIRKDYRSILGTKYSSVILKPFRIYLMLGV